MRRYGIRRTLRRVTTVSSFGVAALVLYGTAYAWGMPRGVTDEARQIYNLYLFMVAMGTLVFVGVVGAMLWSIFRYRRRDPNEMPPQTHGSNIIEMIWTGIPVAIVIALFTYAFIVLQRVEDNSNEPDLSIEVVGFQFQWQFTYDVSQIDPDLEGEISILGTLADEPELVIPVDERIEFVLVSNDVIHSFYVRDFNYKLDLIPGRDNRFAVTPRETGTFIGQCAELCGVDHALMRFTVRVVERAEFDAWVNEMMNNGSAVRER